MSEVLDAEMREQLRQRVDRARRQKIGQRPSDREAWVSLPEAAGMLGIKVTLVRQQVVALQVPTRRVGRGGAGARQIQVEHLPRIREAFDSW